MVDPPTTSRIPDEKSNETDTRVWVAEIDGNFIGFLLNSFFAKLIIWRDPTYLVRVNIGWRTSAVRVSFTYETGKGTDRRRPYVKNKNTS